MKLRTVIVCVLLISASFAVQADSDTPRETTTCGVTERLAFWGWRLAAGSPTLNWKKAAEYDISKVSLKTGDGRTLVGAELHAKGQAKGAVLVIQGNAWAAATLVPYLGGFRDIGYDVFVYDYRGYAMSTPGTPRIRAIIEDYREILHDLHARSYGCIIVYGFSFGGMIAIDSLSREPGWNLMVIDSAPSRISDDGCPPKLDAVNNLPMDCKRIVVISGGKDRLVPRQRAQELIEETAKRGATVWLEPQWEHPWQTYPDSPNEERYKKLKELFLKQ